MFAFVIDGGGSMFVLQLMLNFLKIEIYVIKMIHHDMQIFKWIFS